MLAAVVLLTAAQTTQLPPLWSASSPKLRLEYRLTINGQAEIERGGAPSALTLKVDRTYEGAVVLDTHSVGGYPRVRPRDGYRDPTTLAEGQRAAARFANWSFSFDRQQTDPMLMMTSPVTVRIDDALTLGDLVVQTWRAEHRGRRVTTQAMVDRDAQGPNYDLRLAISDRIGAQDGVTVEVRDPDSVAKGWVLARPPQSGAQRWQVPLTSVPQFAAKDAEFDGTTVQLARLTSPEFERRFEIVRVSNVTVGSASDFKNQSIVATFRVKVVPLR